MKVLNKSGYAFASGMFWQIADEGKRAPNLAKLAKDTNNDMYCYIKSYRPTWGFCKHSELNGFKKVASLGKYIISASGLLGKPNNIIIVYKFKSVNELDEFEGSLNEDLYGYIILLNGTICPDEGDYVSNFESVYESIIQKANRYEIEYLYLTLDVAIRFFSIYELIMDNINKPDILMTLMNNVAYTELYELIVSYKQTHYLSLFEEYSHEVLIKLTKEQFFEAEYKKHKNLGLRFIIDNIYTLNFTSDEAYWHKDILHKYYKQSLLKSLKRQNAHPIKLIIMGVLFVILFYLIYITFIKTDEDAIAFVVSNKPEIPRVTAVNPLSLIKQCVIKNDRYFLDLEYLVLKSLKCDSLSTELTFETNTNLTFNDFAYLIGESNGITFNNQLGYYKVKYWIKNKNIINQQPISHGQILTNLEAAATQYSFILQLQNGINRKVQEFTISSYQSPLFLLKHHILDDVLIRQIQMNLNQSNGLYNWTINGEFKQ